MEAVGAHPFELDPIRRRLCRLFDLRSVTTGKTLFGESPPPHGQELQSHNPLKVVLRYIRRIIRTNELEAFTYGFIDIFARQMIAWAGGLILIVPMVIMTFLRSHHARLIVLCCFVTGFAALIGHLPGQQTRKSLLLLQSIQLFLRSSYQVLLLNTLLSFGVSWKKNEEAKT